MCESLNHTCDRGMVVRHVHRGIGCQLHAYFGIIKPHAIVARPAFLVPPGEQDVRGAPGAANCSVGSKRTRVPSVLQHSQWADGAIAIPAKHVASRICEEEGVPPNIHSCACFFDVDREVHHELLSTPCGCWQAKEAQIKIQSYLAGLEASHDTKKLTGERASAAATLQHGPGVPLVAIHDQVS